MSALDRPDDAQEQLESEAVALVVRLTSGEATDLDREAVEGWRRRSSAHDQAFRKAERLWIGLEPLRGRVTGEGSASERRPDTLTRTTPLVRRRLWIRWGTIAATLTALAVTLTLTMGTFPVLFADARTGTGEQKTIPLDDGSQIHLNTRTAVSIHYSDHARHVDLLAGEAAFRVAMDAARPFIVRTDRGQVRVMGTDFIVQTIAKAVVVTVTEGIVEVSQASDAKPLAPPTLVRAGQRVQHDASGVGPVEAADLRIAGAWQRGLLIFEATPLTVVVEEINRYRHGHIMILSSKLANHRVSGAFDLQRLDSAVAAIERTLPGIAVHLTNRLVLLR